MSDETNGPALPAGWISAGAAIVAATSGKPKKEKTQAQKLMQLVNERYDLIEDPHGQVFAVPKQPPRIAATLRGKGTSLTNCLRGAYFERYGNLPTGANVTGVVDLLEGAASSGEPTPVHIRSVRTDDGIVIDLGDADGRAVVVTADGWKIAKQPPSGVVFRRTRLTAALPTPQRDGSLDELRELLNVTDEGWDLVRAWLVLAWMPHVPVPILCITGQQGAGKSWLGRALVSIVDPSSAMLRSMPRDLGEWQATASASRVVGLDNISRIREEMSDAFCRATTGEGSAKRQLYTDEDLIVQSYRRALLLTSIDPGALKGDLGERLMPVELRRPSRRRGEEELDALLNRSRGRILGALLDLVSGVLATPVSLTSAPRMADAARIMASVDRVTGSSALDAYQRGLANVAETVLESDPLAAAVLSLMEGRDAWTGTPAALYDDLMVRWDPETRNRPGNARTMSERLERIAPALLDVYRLRVERTHGDRRAIELRRVPAARRVVRRRTPRTNE